MRGPHSAPGGGKSSTCDRAPQVVVGVGVAAGRVPRGSLQNRPMRITSKPANGLTQDKLIYTLPADPLAMTFPQPKGTDIY
jgi:hypothetical protein